MKREEEAVDIDAVDDSLETKQEQHAGQANANGELDEDALWADEELDDDIQGWKMKVIVGLEDEED